MQLLTPMILSLRKGLRKPTYEEPRADDVTGPRIFFEVAKN